MISSLQQEMSKTPKHSSDAKLGIVDIELLNKLEKFKQKANDDDVWVSIDADELLQNNRSSRLHDIIELALETARNGCIESSDPKERYIKIRSRNTQNQIFVKILYSCENQKRQYLDVKLRNIGSEIEKMNGYLRHQLNRSEGVIKIAIPD